MEDSPANTRSLFSQCADEIILEELERSAGFLSGDVTLVEALAD